MTPEQHKIVLEALRESVDLLRNDYANAKELYGNYPTRKHRLDAMLAELERHNEAIAIMEAEQPATRAATRDEKIVNPGVYRVALEAESFPPEPRWNEEGTCAKCGGEMKPGKAIAQTYSGTPDFPGGEVVTMSPSGPGKLVDCVKCELCGFSKTGDV